MGVPSITTNLSGFGCFIAETVENPKDFGIYLVDRRLKSVEESISQLTDMMEEFCQKTRRQRINQRNRTERLSDLLDWSRLGQEYIKARFVAIRRKWPNLVVTEGDEDVSEAFGTGYKTQGVVNESNEGDLSSLKYHQKVPRPASVPGSPKSERPEIDMTAHLFDESERESVNVDVLMSELKSLGLRGASELYIPPVTPK